MKKKIAFVLTLAMVMTMFMTMPAMAEGTVYEPSMSSHTSTLAAINSAVAGDTILLAAKPGYPTTTVYHLNYASPEPEIKEGVTFILEENVRLSLGNSNSQGQLYVAPGATMIINGTLDIYNSNAALINKGTVIFGDNSDISLKGPNHGRYKALEGSTTSIPDGFKWNSTRLHNTDINRFDDPIVTQDQLNGLTIRGTDPDPDPDPDPDVTTLDGNAGITITRPDPLPPFLLSPESARAKELFGDAILGGTGFNFGSHKYTAEAQSINSENSLSMIYGYLDPFNEVFTVTCEMSDFLLEDGTPIFNDFSLYMGRQNNSFDREFESEYYASSKAKVYESLAEFNLTKDEPVVVVKTDAVGQVLTNYMGVLNLEANMAAGIGQANATITWNIGVEVI